MFEKSINNNYNNNNNKKHVNLHKRNYNWLLLITFILLFARLSMPNPKLSWLKLNCSEFNGSDLDLDRLFRAIMNNITAINSKIIVVNIAIMTPTKCCSGSWSIGFGDITICLPAKNVYMKIQTRKMIFHEWN